MIKAAAYGHDPALVTSALDNTGIAFWGTATLNEAVELRDLKVRKPIVIMRPLTLHGPERIITDQIKLMRQLGIRPTLVNDEAFRLIAKTASNNSKALYAHIKMDTGMSRNGCLPDDISAILLKAGNVKGLVTEGIYSHFSCADNKSLGCAQRQLALFNSILNGIKSMGVNIPIRHMANSGAIFRMPEARFDMVRPGRAIYGYGNFFLKGSENLVPVMRIEAPVVLTKWIKKGRTCGYGCTYRARRNTRVGLLPLGYADGYSRRWSNTGVVDFKGRRAPVIGMISMDFTTIDLTGIPEAITGSLACVLSNHRKDPHSMESMAQRLKTLPHEIGCNFGSRIQRIASK